MNIEIYSASAGTGKTTRLAELLEEALLSGARPEGILATTFTRKAAAELQERARMQLLANGHVERAQMLGAARIGTVNAVAGQLVRDFAMVLGRSPSLEVLDERGAQMALAQCLALQQDSPERQALNRLSGRLEELHNDQSMLTLERSVQRILELARSNGLGPADLPLSCRLSQESLLALLGRAEPDGSLLDANLTHALQGFIRALDGRKLTQKSSGALREAQNTLHAMHSHGQASWQQWAKLAEIDVAKPEQDDAMPLRHAAARHDVHPQLRADLEQVVALTFAVAGHVMEDYDAYKRQRGVIDFVDQEVLALRALQNAQVRRELQGQLDLVLVDEFQDTSPLQLSLFLKLAELAPRSVWVGDQKQAIYSFRGTDPGLMGAALAELNDQDADNGGDSEVLDRALASLQSARVVALTKSWRSRPALVQATSQLFAQAFAPHGIPRELVEITAVKPGEPEGLGPQVELWDLQLSNNSRTTELPQVAAQGVLGLLRDPTAQVRDRVTGEARPVRPGDVGVLCRKNSTCQIVAQALTRLGVPVQLPQQGVFGTLEGQTFLAGLRLWLAPRSGFPRAVLSRLLDPMHAQAPELWLDAAMAAPRGEAFADLPAVVAVERARDVYESAPLDVCLRACVDALDLRAVCRQWGHGAQRLANVDAMLAHAQVYAQSAADGAATLVGLLYHFEKLQADGQDMCGNLTGQDAGDRDAPGAVQVSTWHASKGLEWPVVVLLGLEKVPERPTAYLGARAESPASAFDLRAPLQGRWIRFWTTPYHGGRKDTPFYERLTAHPLAVNAREHMDREALRLLYVGWTRARDRLVLALHDKPNSYAEGMLQPLEPARMPRPEATTDDMLLRWADTELTIRRRALKLVEAGAPKPVPADASYADAPPRVHPPSRSRPSDAAHTGRVVHRVQLGPRLALRGRPSMAALGSAVHAFFAVHLPHPADDVTARAQAQAVLAAWNVAEHLAAEDLLKASRALRTWVLARWPRARWLTEAPVSLRLPSGTQLAGVADLLVHADAGWALFDHKVFPGGLEEAEHRAAAHSGQLAAYRDGVAAATREPVQHCYIHLPLSGSLIEIAAE